MSKAVVIIGAGASADFGVPTLRDLFKDRHAREYLMQDEWLHRNLKKIFWTPRGHNIDSSDKSLTVEEMLTILKDWENDPKLNNLINISALPKFKRHLYVLIKKAVYDGKSSQGAHLNPLLEFCEENYKLTTWSSFNWDCLFESSFWYTFRKNPNLLIDLDNWRSDTSKHEFLKLHGGINWWIIEKRLTYLQFGSSGSLQQEWRNYANETKNSNTPVILEPSAYKYMDPLYQQTLECQWKVFFDRLCKATHVIIVGYTMPDSDKEARSRIISAFQINPKCKWIVVDPSQEVHDRYLRLLGYERLKCIGLGLSGFNNDLANNLRF